MLFSIYCIALGIVDIFSLICPNEVDYQRVGRFRKFLLKNKTIIFIFRNVLAVLTAALFAIILIAHAQAKDEHKRLEQRMRQLLYMVNADSDGHMQEYYADDVDIWNRELEKRNKLKDDLWVGIFYPNEVCDGLEYIYLDEEV